MDLGPTIRRRREELGLTQDQVSERAGISKPYLSNIETGKAKNPPTDAVLERLERALELEPFQLMHLADMVRTPAYILHEMEERGAAVEKYRSILRRVLAGGVPGDIGQLDLEELADGLDLNDVGPPAFTAGGMVPVINATSAGYPADFTDLDYPPGVADEYVRVPNFADRQGFAARVDGDSMSPAYESGDIVIFAPNTPPREGDDCFVRFAEDGGTTFKRYYQDAPGIIRLQPLNPIYPAKTYPREQITGLWPAVWRIQNLRG